MGTNTRAHTHTHTHTQVQLHVAPIFAQKDTSHGYYEFFRSYFRGNMDAVQDKMAMLKVGQHTHAHTHK